MTLVWSAQCIAVYALTFAFPCAVAQVPVFQWLTSWTREDLASPLNEVQLYNGDLFDRLERFVREDASPWKRRAAVCAQLRVRNTPARPPPRVLVFTGPAGAGKRAVMSGLVAAFPACFARVVAHTTRLPKEHEVDGVDYHFTDAPTLRCAGFLDLLCGRRQVVGTSLWPCAAVALVRTGNFAYLASMHRGCIAQQ